MSDRIFSKPYTDKKSRDSWDRIFREKKKSFKVGDRVVFDAIRPGKVSWCDGGPGLGWFRGTITRIKRGGSLIIIKEDKSGLEYGGGQMGIYYENNPPLCFSEVRALMSKGKDKEN